MSDWSSQNISAYLPDWSSQSVSGYSGTFPSVLQSASSSGAANPTLSAVLSSAPTAGNLLVMVASSAAGSAMSATGFTSLSSSSSTFIGYRVVQGGDSATQTVTYGGMSSNDVCTIGLVEIQNVNSTPIDTSGFSSGVNTSPSITASENNELILVCCTVQGNPINTNLISGPPTGYTTIVNSSNSGSLGNHTADYWLACADLLTAGATGTSAWTVSGTADQCGTIGVRSI